MAAIRPDILLRMRRNRFYAGMTAVSCVFGVSSADEYWSLAREAVGPSEEELRALAAAAVQRRDRDLYNFACDVFTASGYRRAA